MRRRENEKGAMRWDRKVGPSVGRKGTKEGGGPASCYRKVAGLIPL